MTSNPSQEIFDSCYRGTQTPIRHKAYMRLAKVFLALRLLRELNVSLSGKSILDYGFGAGTFFLHCPKNARLFGVEADQQNVSECQAYLKAAGYPDADLQTIDIRQIETHTVFSRKYDVILCSHVLEHISAPVPLMHLFKNSMNESSVLLVLLPINERFPDAHHEHVITSKKVKDWAAASGLQVIYEKECDPWIYSLQFFFVAESGWRHRVAQGFSVCLGLLAHFLGEKRWADLSDLLQSLPVFKPVQLGVALQISPRD
jgi:2-polyprenyl-3-methyl-5-hydroxy-6-metoxy-1,4-benzoquinol methylase